MYSLVLARGGGALFSASYDDTVKCWWVPPTLRKPAMGSTTTRHVGDSPRTLAPARSVGDCKSGQEQKNHTTAAADSSLTSLLGFVKSKRRRTVDGLCTATLRGHMNMVVAIQLSSDEETLFSG